MYRNLVFDSTEINCLISRELGWLSGTSHNIHTFSKAAMKQVHQNVCPHFRNAHQHYRMRRVDAPRLLCIALNHVKKRKDVEVLRLVSEVFADHESWRIFFLSFFQWLICVTVTSGRNVYPHQNWSIYFLFSSSHGHLKKHFPLHSGSGRKAYNNNTKNTL